LLLRALLGLLQRGDTAFSLVFNPTLSPLEFLRYIVGDFGLATAGKAKDELLHALNVFLLQRYQQARTTLLVVDEAHHLSPEVLEEIRLLTNLETSQQKLLQIVLAGQPELDQNLDTYDLRQLKQRIALHCHLDCLNANETGEYIRRRLTIAGAESGKTLFDEGAITAVHRYSKGVPRLVNTICENSLLAGYAKQQETVTQEIIDGVALDLRLVPALMEEKGNGQVGAEDENLLRAVKILLEKRGQADPKGRLQ